jgi:hypothetical protein
MRESGRTVIFALGLIACQRELAPDDACRRLETSTGHADGGWSNEEREICRTQWASLTRDSRVCMSKCLDKEPQRTDDCADDCGASTAYPVVLCTAMAPDGGSAEDACIVRLGEVRARRPRAYGCVATCVKRAAASSEAAKCEARCGL